MVLLYVLQAALIQLALAHVTKTAITPSSLYLGMMRRIVPGFLIPTGRLTS